MITLNQPLHEAFVRIAEANPAWSHTMPDQNVLEWVRDVVMPMAWEAGKEFEYTPDGLTMEKFINKHIE